MSHQHQQQPSYPYQQPWTPPPPLQQPTSSYPSSSYPSSSSSSSSSTSSSSIYNPYAQQPSPSSSSSNPNGPSIRSRAAPPSSSSSSSSSGSLSHSGSASSLSMNRASASSPDPNLAINLEAGGGAGGGGGGSYGGYVSSGGGFRSPAPSRSSSYATESTLKNYTLFMYTLIGLCVATSLLALLTMSSSLYIVFVLSICTGSILFTLHITRWVFSKDDNHAAMKVISEAIREGSEGFLRVQYTTIGVIAIGVAGFLAFVYLIRESPSKHISQFTLAWITAICYITGAACSGLAGYIGVWVSVRVNIRVAVAASKHHYADAFLLAFRGGAVSACLSASLCIVGLTLLYVLCHLFFHIYGSVPAHQIPILLAGYGFGAALVALFMQLGGGIYTKAADVGADMIGKVEAGIPEDDCRNPAVIADLVGDNVGDNAGSMADVFESIAAEIIGTMILGATLAEEAHIESPQAFIFFPLCIHALDLVVSGIGIWITASASDKEDPLETMKRSYGVSMLIACIGFVTTCRLCLYTEVAPEAWYYYAACGLLGIVMSYLLIRTTQYYTDYTYNPVKRIAAASQTGHGTNVIAGLAVGLESTGIPSIVISIALFLAYTLGKNSGLPSAAAGIFGTAVATMGMLCTAVFVLSMNNFGPIADNAGGIVEMSGQSESVRVITDRLDAVGNVTKAASKGYAVGGSALSCFVLFQAFLDEISAFIGTPFDTINIARVEVLIGCLLGMMMICVFAGWSMSSVGTTAQKVVWEVRRQFKDKPGIMDGSDKPDYATCVEIVTRAALKEMIAPAILALGLPIFIGFFFRSIGESRGLPLLGVEVVAGFMIAGTLTGLLLAMFMDNSGGAWDNAKKLIESQGLKGSEQHKAAVTGDTVGDPFKDTAGPALHVIITTMSTTILVLGPMFVGTLPK